ncbi:hypothetical protein Nepgr_016984 [Nepenthes gracilis]|uniref:Pentatricopeptide repeat-containing protein n=1 Tax=Nepenthes gracilis TaxID=150966 RepID=A0AAD3SPM6_NEPGR|nr:hypothetical protein Nepgr_016984 [Nepenthes gracilis]
MLPGARFLSFCPRFYGFRFHGHLKSSQSFVDEMHSISAYLNTHHVFFSSFHSIDTMLKSTCNFTYTRISPDAKKLHNIGQYRYRSILLYSSRSYRQRVNRRLRLQNQPVLDEAQFSKTVSQLPPRFTADDLHNAIALEDDPLVCLELHNWASKQPRFRHSLCSYHITIKKLGAAKMYKEMDVVVNQVLAIPHIGSEALYNTMIYYFTEARKLTRAVNIFKHMRSSKNLDCRPSIRTYNLLFAAFLSRGNNTYVNHMYAETMRCLFRQLVKDGIEPEIFSLNSMIKAYVLSNHVNEALRLFHQMGVVYTCMPNAVSYDYIIHGLCAQCRTNNATELLKEMKEKGFVPNIKTYNSVVNSLSLNGEVDKAVGYLCEMTENQRPADLITYKTLLDQFCRQGRVGDAVGLLKEFRKKDLVDEITYSKLLNALQDDFAIGRNLSL